MPLIKHRSCEALTMYMRLASDNITSSSRHNEEEEGDDDDKEDQGEEKSRKRRKAIGGVRDVERRRGKRPREGQGHGPHDSLYNCRSSLLSLFLNIRENGEGEVVVEEEEEKGRKNDEEWFLIYFHLIIITWHSFSK